MYDTLRESSAAGSVLKELLDDGGVTVGNGFLTAVKGFTFATLADLSRGAADKDQVLAYLFSAGYGGVRRLRLLWFTHIFFQVER